MCSLIRQLVDSLCMQGCHKHTTTQSKTINSFVSTQLTSKTHTICSKTNKQTKQKQQQQNHIIFTSATKVKRTWWHHFSAMKMMSSCALAPVLELVPSRMIQFTLNAHGQKLWVERGSSCNKHREAEQDGYCTYDEPPQYPGCLYTRKKVIRRWNHKL